MFNRSRERLAEAASTLGGLRDMSYRPTHEWYSPESSNGMARHYDWVASLDSPDSDQCPMELHEWAQLSAEDSASYYGDPFSKLASHDEEWE